MTEPARPDAAHTSELVRERVETVVPMHKSSELSNPQPQPSGKNWFRRGIVVTALLTGCVFGGNFGYNYWTAGRFLERTDDAYVKAELTAVAPKVSGYISEVLVRDNDEVKAGQLLARIDDRDYQNALLQARADVGAAEAAVANVDAQIVLQEALIVQAGAAARLSLASLIFAQSESSRAQRLITSGVGTLARVEQSQSVHDQAKAAVERDRAALLATEAKLPVLETQRQQAEAQRHRAAAAVSQAELNLSYTRIVAPIDGTIGARSLRLGQLVASGMQLMAVVPLHSVYVVANFKETQLTFLEVGQPVSLSVDSYPGHIVEGHVDSISPGSGSEFSLLPSDNATGNFTKVVQRIPVKIVLEQNNDDGYLRAGMSVVTAVDIRSALERQ